MTLLAAGFFALVTIQLWFTASGRAEATRVAVFLRLISGEQFQPPSRFDWEQGATALFIQRTYETLASGPHLLWSMFGPLLVALLFLLWASPWKARISLACAAFLVPIAVALTAGDDPTRDTVLIVAPTILALCVVTARRIEIVSRSLVVLPLMGFLIVVASMTPMTYQFEKIEYPYRFITQVLIANNNGVTFDWSGDNR